VAASFPGPVAFGMGKVYEPAHMALREALLYVDHTNVVVMQT